MPELPEVETVVRDLAAAELVGRRIVCTRTHKIVIRSGIALELRT